MIYIIRNLTLSNISNIKFTLITAISLEHVQGVSNDMVIFMR